MYTCLFLCSCMSVLHSGWHIWVCSVSKLLLLAIHATHSCYLIHSLASCYCEFYKHCFEPEVYSVVFRIFTDQFSGPAGAISPLCLSFELSDLSPRYLSCWFTLTLSRSSLKSIFIDQEFTIAGRKCVLFFSYRRTLQCDVFFIVCRILCAQNQRSHASWKLLEIKVWGTLDSPGIYMWFKLTNVHLAELTLLLIELLLHLFNGHFSRITWVSRHQKGKPVRILLKQEMMGWQWYQLDHMQIICTSLQTDKHASTPPLSIYRPDALPAIQPTLSKHWRHYTTIFYIAFFKG